MDHHRKLSESSDDGNDSIELPPSLNCDEKKTEEIIQLNHESFDEFKRSIEELKSEYDRNHPTLISKINELEDITDEIESVHKNSRVGSLVGSSIGAVGGVTALVGLALAPFTLGASLALTAVGAVAGAAGGVTGAASNFTDMFKQKNLKQTIEKIISDFLEIIKPMTEYLSTISDSAADIQRMYEILSKVKFQTSARGFDDLFKIVKVADVALIGKLCEEAVNAICVLAQAVNAIRGLAQAVNAISGSAQAGRCIRGSAQAVNAISGSAQAGRSIRATARNAKFIRMSAAATGALSVLFLALDVASIVEDSKELNEMNQPAKERKAEEIKSETLKFIHQMRDLASQFQKTLDKIKCVINNTSVS